MIEHVILGVILGFAIAANVWAIAMVREAQRLTKAVGALVIQETDKIPGKS